MALIHLDRDDRAALRREALASDRLEHGLVRDLGTFLGLAQHDMTHRFRPTRRRR